MSAPILSVVRYRPDAPAEGRTAWIGQRRGHYVASGGAGFTADLQKAQVFGFSANARRRMARDYGRQPDVYEIVPVLLVT